MSPTITGRRSDRRPRGRLVAEPQLASIINAGSRNFRPVPYLKRPPAHTTISPGNQAKVACRGSRSLYPTGPKVVLPFIAVRLPLRASARVYPLRRGLANVTTSVTL
jgi:hypothetical protein